MCTTTTTKSHVRKIPILKEDMSDELTRSSNEDWCATSVIYGGKVSTEGNIDGTFCGIIEIPISVTHVVFACRISDDPNLLKPSFRYWTLSREESPVVKLCFVYDNNSNQPPKTVDISFSKFFNDDDNSCGSWLAPMKHQFQSWLKEKSEKIMQEEQMSYSVCSFIEHEAWTIFDSTTSDDDEGFVMVFLPPRIELDSAEYTGVGGTVVSPYHMSRHRRRARESRLDSFAKDAILARWRDHCTFSCPICFEKTSLQDGYELSCDHIFCRPCLTMYTQIKSSELAQHRTNPFLCPVEGCSECMSIDGDVQELLPDEHMARVRHWESCLAYPPCWSLVCCLSRRCGKEGSIRWSHPDRSDVFCDECGVTWCILCLKLYKSEPHECDRSQVMKLCRRYIACSSESIKAKCEAMYPWIKIYARSQLGDDTCVDWVRENGQICPACATGVERIEGCFHMHCPCGAHFCYECGGELHPPYYGTHHCWET